MLWECSQPEDTGLLIIDSFNISFSASSKTAYWYRGVTIHMILVQKGAFYV